jgi:hypothetical protein
VSALLLKAVMSDKDCHVWDVPLPDLDPSIGYVRDRMQVRPPVILMRQALSTRKRRLENIGI